MTRILILGASGFLGCQVVRAALRVGHDVVAAGRESEALARIPGTAGAQRIHLDALQLASVEATIDDVDASAVILCTALARIDECERYPGLARALNVELPTCVAHACAATGRRLVHVSTDLVFGAIDAPRTGFDEDTRPRPVSAYGKTKAEGEASVLSAYRNALVVRLPLLYGESFGRALGASDAVVAAVERGDMPVLFDDEWRTPLPVECAADALVESASRTESGVLHVAGPERVSRLELGVLALRARSLTAREARSRVRATKRAAEGMGHRPADVALDARRARALLATRLPDPWTWFRLERSVTA